MESQIVLWLEFRACLCGQMRPRPTPQHHFEVACCNGIVNVAMARISCILWGLPGLAAAVKKSIKFIYGFDNNLGCPRWLDSYVADKNQVGIYKCSNSSIVWAAIWDSKLPDPDLADKARADT